MGQLESLMELDIAQSKKKKYIYALVDLSTENFIVLYHYIGKILKPHDYKLIHFTPKRICGVPLFRYK
jgi:hypothetical protein